MKVLDDVSCGDWLLARAGEWGQVGGVAGVGLEAYARILHPVPVTHWDTSVVDEWGMPRVIEQTTWPWSEVAARQGLVMHPLVQWNRLADLHQGITFPDGWEVGQTEEGRLAPELLAALTQHLVAATTAPEDLTIGLWDGWGELSGRGVAWYVEEERAGLGGWLDRRRAQQEADAAYQARLSPEVRRAVRSGPFFEWPDRRMLLLATSARELADPTWPHRAGIGWREGDPGPMPQLIWPADRAWVVASEIDWDSTIVAGSRALVDAVLADERLEAHEVDEDSDLTWEGDVVNPPRAGWCAGS